MGVLLPLGTKPDEIPARLELYQNCRKERAEFVQEVTRMSGADVTPSEKDTAAKIMQFFVYNCGHDEYHSSTQKLRDWMYKKNPRVRWRMPTSFGPFPRRQQDTQGRTDAISYSTFVTRSVKFKTSRTLLQNMLPMPAFSFTAPGTFAYATYSQTTFDGVEWLGGKGYNSIEFYLHGVQYKKKDGTLLTGRYLAVMWEDLADSVMSGREELGLPKLFADIDVTESPSVSTVEASWRKAAFLTLELGNLEDVGISDDALKEADPAYK